MCYGTTMPQDQRNMPSHSVSPVVEKLHDLVQSNAMEFEITILPSASITNDDPKHQLSLAESVVLMEGKYLGLDARSLPWITRTIRKDYKTIKKNGFPELDDDLSLRKLLMITQCLMLVNPDHSTAWADRRRCLLALSGDWYQELKFINLLMTQHSKAPSSWGHRKYVLQKIIHSKLPFDKKGKTSSYEQMIVLMQEEIEVCRKVAEKYPKNYYAWTHRRYLWSACILPHTSPDHTDTLGNLLKEEFTTVQTWIEHHISDHSAVHYISEVLGIWVDHSRSDDELLLDIAKTSLGEVHRLLHQHPDHECLWILRRLVLRILLDNTSTTNKSCGDRIRSLLQADVDGVYHNFQDSNQIGSAAPKNASVHAWSFLAWCMVQLDLGGGPDQAKRLDKVVSCLRAHPQICHQMWQNSAHHIAKRSEG